MTRPQPRPRHRPEDAARHAAAALPGRAADALGRGRAASPRPRATALETARALLRRYAGHGRVADRRRPASRAHHDVARRWPTQRQLVARAEGEPGRACGTTCGPRRCSSPTASTAARGPSRRKPLVNLWHGDGPKATRPGNGAGVADPEHLPRRPAPSCSAPQGRGLRGAAERLLVTGNPRTDQLWRPPARQPSQAWGSPVTSWCGCRRSGSTRAVGAVRSWSESAAPAVDDGLAARRRCSRAWPRAGSSWW